MHYPSKVKLCENKVKIYENAAERSRIFFFTISGHAKLQEKRSMMDNETIACCQLSRVFGYNPTAGRKLIEAVGSALDVFRLKQNDLQQLLGVSPPQGLDRQGFEASKKELEDLSRKGCTYLGITSEVYPELLKECDDPPIGLYMKCSSPPEEVFRERPTVAVVGTRDLSHYGLEWTRKITAALCSTKNTPVIVSGLALGADITAHKTALECGASTIAVMATGIDDVYPRMHGYDADRIAAAPGSALISDYPPGTGPVANNFLRRNRIIAGLSQATILTESRVKGGGMMTANLAWTYNRDVFVLPGKIDDLRSGGCNKLIAEKKAEIILTPEDMMIKMGLIGPRRKGLMVPDPEKIYLGSMPPDQVALLSAIFKLIRINRGISKQDLCRASGMSIGEINSYTSLMEADGLIYIDLLGNCSVRDKLE